MATDKWGFACLFEFVNGSFHFARLTLLLKFGYVALFGRRWVWCRMTWLKYIFRTIDPHQMKQGVLDSSSFRLDTAEKGICNEGLPWSCWPVVLSAKDCIDDWRGIAQPPGLYKKASWLGMSQRVSQQTAFLRDLSSRLLLELLLWLPFVMDCDL